MFCELVPTTLAGRFQPSGGQARRSGRGSADVWNSELKAAFSLSSLCFPAAFLLKLHPERHKPLSKIRENRAVSLWAMILWNRLRNTLAYASRQQLNTDKRSHTRITAQRLLRLLGIICLAYPGMCMWECACVRVVRKERKHGKNSTEKAEKQLTGIKHIWKLKG